MWTRCSSGGLYALGVGLGLAYQLICMLLTSQRRAAAWNMDRRLRARLRDQWLITRRERTERDRPWNRGLRRIADYLRRLGGEFTPAGHDITAGSGGGSAARRVAGQRECAAARRRVQVQVEVEVEVEQDRAGRVEDHVRAAAASGGGCRRSDRRPRREDAIRSPCLAGSFRLARLGGQRPDGTSRGS
jgi:hypothetical protein